MVVTKRGNMNEGKRKLRKCLVVWKYATHPYSQRCLAREKDKEIYFVEIVNGFL
jgi:hypothetical protein